MSISKSHFRNLLAGMLLSLFVASPVLADDAEIFVSRPGDVGARPNVLFVIDTSGRWTLAMAALALPHALRRCGMRLSIS